MKKALIFLFSLPINIIGWVLHLIFGIVGIALAGITTTFNTIMYLLALLFQSALNRDINNEDPIAEMIVSFMEPTKRRFWKWRKFTIKKI